MFYYSACEYALRSVAFEELLSLDRPHVTSFCDWLAKRVPLFQPISSKTKTKPALNANAPISFDVLIGLLCCLAKVVTLIFALRHSNENSSINN